MTIDIAAYVNDAVTSYIGAGLWLSACNGTASHGGCRGEDCDKGLDDLGFTVSDVFDASVADIRTEVRDFVTTCNTERPAVLSEWTAEQFGYDFWLTRNGHGAGFWDRGRGESGRWLTDMANPFGECLLFVDPDGDVQYQS